MAGTSYCLVTFAPSRVFDKLAAALSGLAALPDDSRRR